MKKILAAIMAILMILTLTACSDSPVEMPESTPDSTPESTPATTDSVPTEPESTESQPTETEPEPTETEPEPLVPADPLHVMSYNVYTSSPDRNRVKKVVNNIKSFDPDIIGVQELNHSWTVILNMVSDLLDVYAMVGKPRLDPADKSNNNEYSAILYKKDMFELIDTNTFWLSDTPDKVSKFESTEYYRIMTYAVLERKSDGFRFIHFNTHLATDSASRHKQIEILLSLAGTVLEKHGELPLYFTGDFNMSQSDAGYKSMLGWMLEDTRTLSPTANHESTCGSSIIDYCFVSKGDFTVEEFDVGHGLEGSDHYPVYVKMRVNGTENQ